ncbi:uncharacterized protein METZ01_LOCUS19187 [marine metagenome]|uniref:Uncharacterized protein n=1 Tax=marine metagenome TaxID=408172 RepID=A0A381PLK6_9ZZZZ
MSLPSSVSTAVNLTGSKLGPAAVYTLRMPRSYEIQAMRSADFEAVTSTG